MSSQRAYARGFTLLEMTVVLLLVALMSSVIIQGLSFGMRTYAQVVKGNDANWDAFLAQRFLRGAIETAYPFDPRRRDNKAYGLEGTSSQLSISAAMARSAVPGALNRYELSVVVDEHRRDLLLTWQPDRNGSSGAPVHREILVKNIERLELSYAACGTGNNQWLDVWQGHQTLPALVRVRVIFPMSDLRQWPELIVAPRVTHDATSWVDQQPSAAPACGRTR